MLKLVVKLDEHKSIEAWHRQRRINEQQMMWGYDPKISDWVAVGEGIIREIIYSEP